MLWEDDPLAPELRKSYYQGALLEAGRPAGVHCRSVVRADASGAVAVGVERGGGIWDVFLETRCKVFS